MEILEHVFLETLGKMFEVSLVKLKKKRFFGLWRWEVTLIPKFWSVYTVYTVYTVQVEYYSHHVLHSIHLIGSIAWKNDFWFEN